ncbi:unnamed protein product [Macrosiphum euphorbiae]|uniref:Uncharacterized protein n=1 Tax=Macrosiphum euphorbiae TaxID=13131 RepID=A0AAV0X626_9HEMI|nr:unnamed protein product [Macrosiphum euphorbiae]
MGTTLLLRPRQLLRTYWNSSAEITTCQDNHPVNCATALLLITDLTAKVEGPGNVLETIHRQCIDENRVSAVTMSLVNGHGGCCQRVHWSVYR